MHTVEAKTWRHGMLEVRIHKFIDVETALHFAKHSNADKIRVYEEEDVLIWIKEPGQGDYA